MTTLQTIVYLTVQDRSRNMKNNPATTRKHFLKQAASILILSKSALACSNTDSEWCSESQINSDGDFPTIEECALTKSNIEGPYYISNAPQRNDLRIFGDQGEEMIIEGSVFDGECLSGIAEARIEFWHANPNGHYDNTSDEMKYRCVVVTNEEGYFRLDTLLPGRYKNGLYFRPRHIHVKIWDSNGTEKLTTQLYFEGDEHLDCDEFANTSLVMTSTGKGDLNFSNIHFVV
jgi:protocatechuate 3,4-dioxygenase beta subunit